MLKLADLPNVTITVDRHVLQGHYTSGKSVTIGEWNHASGVYKEHYT